MYERDLLDDLRWIVAREKNWRIRDDVDSLLKCLLTLDDEDEEM
jgi:hypothetical protein